MTTVFTDCEGMGLTKFLFVGTSLETFQELEKADSFKRENIC